MLRVGLTGGIGSGKSTVARIFEILQVPVFDADTAARQLMNESPSVREAVIKTFGEDSYLNNKLNKKFISEIVFNDPQKLVLLNAIVHPATLQNAQVWFSSQLGLYAIKEAALLFEAGAEKDLDYVIGVSSPLPLRMQRIQQRDHFSPAEIQARMDKQMNEEEKMQRCDFVLFNDEKQLLLPQVIALHEKFQQLALSHEDTKAQSNTEACLLISVHLCDTVPLCFPGTAL
jgi:dephospho-CoA kinase